MWQDEARQWLRDLFPSTRTFTVSVHRERQWGSIWKLVVDDGGYWFKRGHPALWREVGLRRVLIRFAPNDVLPCFADDAERGWMLTADQGATLAGRAREEGSHHYAELAAALARVQRAVDPVHLEALDLPVFAPEDATARLDDVLAWFAALPGDHPAHVDDRARAQALVRIEGLVNRWAELGRGLPGVGLDHNDLHAGNAYPGPRISDWGDAVMGHPFGSLRPLLFAANDVFGREAAATVRSTYLRHWGDPEELAEALEVAMQLTVVQRLHCWISLDDVNLVATYADYVTPLIREIGVQVLETSCP